MSRRRPKHNNTRALLPVRFALTMRTMRIVPATESLTVEFKSDRKGLSDTDVVLAAV